MSDHFLGGGAARTLSDADAVAEARAYIAIFRQHTLPNTSWVKTQKRRIDLDTMSDADALFVASEFRRMEDEAFRSVQGRRRRRN